MSMNKKLLAAAITSLLVAGNAGAVVLGTDPARTYAIEIVNGTTLTDANDDIEVALGYNFSGGEVRYGRLECTSNVTIGSPTITEGSADITLGAINGAGTPALFFSITATNPVSGPTSGVVLNLDSAITLLDKGAVSCAFSIYDQPSQAQAGGEAGRIRTTGFRPFISRAKSFAFTTSGGSSIADVQATPSYTHFVSNDRDFGSLTFGLSAAAAGGTVFDVDGTAITLADIFAPTTKVEVSGSFNAATSVAWVGDAASTLTTTKATWTSGELGLGGTGVSGVLTYNENGTTEIAVSDYSAFLDVVTNAGYEASDESLTGVGSITRNGTQIQAPLVHVPASGYVSRIALTNTGATARPYTIRVLKEDGTTLSTGTLTGTIPAAGTKVVELNTVITGFTAGAPRATVIVTADAPNTEVQGLYQIVNPASGAISNHVMVRPGTN